MTTVAFVLSLGLRRPRPKRNQLSETIAPHMPRLSNRIKRQFIHYRILKELTFDPSYSQLI